MRHLVFILVLALCVSATISADLAEHLIPWSPAEHLEWSDFGAKPKATSPHDALSHCGLAMDMSMKNKELSFTVTAVFDTKKSWVKENATNDSLLAHEQLHFDIYERYARELRKELLAASYGDVDSISDQINRIYARVNEDLRAAQAAYDQETDHSLIHAVQKKWNERIAAELVAMEDYREESVSLSLGD